MQKVLILKSPAYKNRYYTQGFSELTESFKIRS
jgi:hypothetical protein